MKYFQYLIWSILERSGSERSKRWAVVDAGTNFPTTLPEEITDPLSGWESSLAEGLQLEASFALTDESVPC